MVTEQTRYESPLKRTYSTIPQVEGTIRFPRYKAPQSIEQVVALPPAIIDEQSYERQKDIEGVNGHPDLFYAIGQERRLAGKPWDRVDDIGVSPIVVNRDLFEQGGVRSGGRFFRCYSLCNSQSQI